MYYRAIAMVLVLLLTACAAPTPKPNAAPAADRSGAPFGRALAGPAERRLTNIRLGKVHTLAGLIAFDRAHAKQEMPWFGQDLFIKAEAKGPLTDPAYQKALAKEKRLAGPEGIDAALAAHHLDALMAPATGPAWVSDLVDGDNFGGGGYSPAAVAGYPSITVPAGNVHGLPVGMVFLAGKWSEPTLIGIGYGFEQVTRARIRPRLEAHAPRAAEVPTLAERTGATVPLTEATTARPICGSMADAHG